MQAFPLWNELERTAFLTVRICVVIKHLLNFYVWSFISHASKCSRTLINIFRRKSNANDKKRHTNLLRRRVLLCRVCVYLKENTHRNKTAQSNTLTVQCTSHFGVSYTLPFLQRSFFATFAPEETVAVPRLLFATSQKTGALISRLVAAKRLKMGKR